MSVERQQQKIELLGCMGAASLPLSLGRSGSPVGVRASVAWAGSAISPRRLKKIFFFTARYAFILRAFPLVHAIIIAWPNETRVPATPSSLFVDGIASTWLYGLFIKD